MHVAHSNKVAISLSGVSDLIRLHSKKAMSFQSCEIASEQVVFNGCSTPGVQLLCTLCPRQVSNVPKIIVSKSGMCSRSVQEMCHIALCNYVNILFAHKLA